MMGVVKVLPIGKSRAFADLQWDVRAMFTIARSSILLKMQEAERCE